MVVALVYHGYGLYIHFIGMVNYGVIVMNYWSIIKVRTYLFYRAEHKNIGELFRKSSIIGLVLNCVMSMLSLRFLKIYIVLSFYTILISSYYHCFIFQISENGENNGTVEEITIREMKWVTLCRNSAVVVTVGWIVWILLVQVFLVDKLPSGLYVRAADQGEYTGW